MAAFVVALLAVAAFVASRIDLPYYALSPGSAQAVDPLVTVPKGMASTVHGDVLLTDVLLTRVTLLTYLPDTWSSDTDVVPADEVLSPLTPPDQLVDQGYLQMAASQMAAKTAALRRLGYPVPEHDAGTLIASVAPGSPAARALRVGQIVTAVGATPTPDACAFVAALHTRRPGDVVDLTVERTSIAPDGRVTPGATVHRSVRLAKAAPHETSSGCPGVVGPNRAFLGVEASTQQEFSYPFPVSVDTAGIGGPSAGLAMTLGIIDKLSGGHLTGGATVAATGTISPDGTVGDVGGVAQKTIAVERAGATVFLVPPPEYQVARSEATPSLHVYKVSTLDQALAVLHRLGGQLPAGPSAPTGS